MRRRRPVNGHFPSHKVPFQHTAEELQVLFKWVKVEILLVFELAFALAAVLAMKLLSCSENGSQMLLAWPTNGVRAHSSLQDAAP
jgi:hypothetical protein